MALPSDLSPRRPRLRGDQFRSGGELTARHGTTGRGDGEAGRGLSPPPGNLAWLSQMPMAQWDPFMYWTSAEGGARFETAMPAFKSALSGDDIWAVTAYIQARLPQKSK